MYRTILLKRVELILGFAEAQKLQIKECTSTQMIATNNALIVSLWEISISPRYNRKQPSLKGTIKLFYNFIQSYVHYPSFLLSVF